MYDLVGSAEAAELLGIGPTNFSHLKRKLGHAFPAPVIELRCGPIWRRTDILVWQETHKLGRWRPKLRRLLKQIERLDEEGIDLLLSLLA